jgi:hypothetical protein
VGYFTTLVNTADTVNITTPITKNVDTIMMNSFNLVKFLKKLAPRTLPLLIPRAELNPQKTVTEN